MVEENAKKIETLTRIAKLLGEQVREQNKKIDKLTQKFTDLKEYINQISPLKISDPAQMGENIDSAPTSFSEIYPPNIKSQIVAQENDKTIRPFVEKSSEKEELLKALRVIDDL